MNVEVGKFWSANNVCTFSSTAPIPAFQLCQQWPLQLKFKNGSCTFRDHQHGTVISGFPSGKHLLVGANTWLAANDASRQYIDMLRSFGVTSAELNTFRVRNITLTIQLSTGIIDLVAFDEFVKTLNGGKSTYHPDVFPGARLRFVHSKIVVTVFKSSRCIITGAKTTKDAIAAFNAVRPYFERFIVHDEEERKAVELKIAANKKQCASEQAERDATARLLDTDRIIRREMRRLLKEEEEENESVHEFRTEMRMQEGEEEDDDDDDDDLNVPEFDPNSLDDMMEMINQAQ